jgi:hypothetical protein
LKELLKNIKDKLIILDNASSHRNDTIKNFIKNSGNDYLYILTYKHYIKLDKPSTLIKLKESLSNSI